MIKVGFIGYGSMGSMLINQLILSKALAPDEIIVFNRTEAKLKILREKYQEITVASNVQEVAMIAKYIFICTKPLDIIKVLDEIADVVKPETHIISIAGAINADYIHKQTGVKVSKLIPTVISEVRAGVSLLYHNGNVPQEDAKYIEELLNAISEVKVIKTDNFHLVTEITSCGPGLIAGIFNAFLDSAVKYTDCFSKDEIEDMLIKTLYGTAKLFVEKGMNFEETIARVATKGGITEEGIIVLMDKLPNCFDEMFERTLNKRKALIARIDEAQVLR